MSDAANTIAIPSDYAWVACSVGLIGLVQFWLGGRAMGPRKHFKAANVLDNPKMKALQDEHKKLYGESVSLMGYPDMGNGRYSEFLSYEQWFEINNSQRGHYNMIESSGPVLSSLLVGGLFYPKLFAFLGATYATGRVLYALGYSSQGPNGRRLGSALSFLGQMALYFGAIICGVRSKFM